MKRRIGSIIEPILSWGNFRKTAFVFLIWYGLFACDLFAHFGGRIPKTFPYFVHLVFQPACYAGVLTAMFLLLGRRRWVMWPFFAYVVFVECLELSVVYLFGNAMTGELLPIALNSSWREVGAFFTEVVPGVLWGACAGAIGLCAWVAKFLFSIRFHQTIKCRLAWSALLVVPFVAFDLCFLSPTLIPQQMLFVQLVVDSVDNLAEKRALYEACVRPLPVGEVSLDGTEGDDLVGVFMIGESLTRNSMSVYGYARDTTPCMRRLQSERLFVFKDLLGCWFNTQGALCHLLTERELNGRNELFCTLPQVYSQAGFGCSLLSNQGHWGPFDSFVTLIFRACYDATWQGDDETDLALVGKLENKLVGGMAGPQMFFLHLWGSHWPPMRYSKEYAKFSNARDGLCPKRLDARGRRLYNEYDNTVLQTDAVFDGVVRLLERLKRPAFVVFVSDHGETPRHGRMRVAEDDDLWEIPLVVWVSEEYAKAYPDVVRQLRKSVDKRLQQDQLFVGLLSLARVKDYLRYTPERDFLSDAFEPRSPRMIQNGKVPYGERK